MSVGLRLETTDSWEAFEPRWRALEATGWASPFQRADWLRHWYASFTRRGSIDPLLVAVTDTRSGEDVMLLPLIVRRRGLLTSVEFADLGVTDNNAPLLGPRAPLDADGARGLWSVLADGLSSHDVIRLQKMPRRIAERDNPLMLGGRARVSHLSRWVAEADDEWVAERKASNSYKRSRKRFAKAGSGRFLFASNADEASRILATLYRLQVERLRELGRAHILSQPQHRRFYEALGENPKAGFCYFTALELDGDLVAALLAVSAKPNVTLLRIAADPKYSDMSLGRHLMELTVIALQEQGYHDVDFSLGEAGHKAKLGASPQHVYDVIQSLTWQGSLYLKALEARRLFGQLGQPQQRQEHSSAT